jgi:hypothetical protein
MAFDVTYMIDISGSTLHAAENESVSMALLPWV